MKCTNRRTGCDCDLEISCISAAVQGNGMSITMQPALLVLFLAFCGLCPTNVAGVNQEAVELFNKCKQQTHATEDVDAILKTSKFPKSSEGKCMLHCVLESKGLMKGKQVETLAFADYFQKLYAKQPKQLEIAARAIAICGILLQDTKGLDKCEVAAKVFQCGKDNQLSLS